MRFDGLALLLCLGGYACGDSQPQDGENRSQAALVPKAVESSKLRKRTKPIETDDKVGERSIVIGSGFSLNSEILGQSRNINVILPLSYKVGGQKYPVLYLIDGGVQQDLIPVAGFGALATLSGQYREFIIVGVETVNRRFELTTPSTLAFDLLQIPNNGGADDFRRFILEEVQPAIISRYRTTKESAVLGESLAGLFIVDTFLRNPESFTHYIAVSPSLWWKDKELATSSAEYLSVGSFPKHRSLYLASADEEDIGEAIKPLHQALKTNAPKSLAWWYQPMPAEHHNTIYHPATLNALRLLFATSDEKKPNP